MEDELMHSLSAAYALHALSADEEREYEAHLAGCRKCQEEVASFTGTVTALAFGAPPEHPPAELRKRILDSARVDRPNVVTLRPRWAYPALVAAAVAGSAAVGLGIWAASLHSQLGAPRALALKGAAGSVVVSRNGDATLVVAGLPRVPGGKTYEVWVLLGRTPERAGLFGSSVATVHLTRRVPDGATVAVTLERAGGVASPTGTPVLTSAPA